LSDLFLNRRKKVLEHALLNSDAFLLTNRKNIRYLTGFNGSFALALFTSSDNILLVDFRYREQAKKETEMQVVEFKNTWLDALKKIISQRKIKRLSFESTLSYETFALLSKLKRVELSPLSHLVEKTRALKDREEIEYIKVAVKRAEEAFLSVRPYIKEGISEREIAIMLEHEIRKQGADELPFPVIVASGENSSMPHWRNSERILRKGDFILIDWGAEYKGYYSDMTRTFVLGKPSDRQKHIYEIVNNARLEAIKAIRQDKKAKKIDAKARNLIKQSGYGENFGHATGHGIGMDVHEFPKISVNSEDIIKPGMVFTIEPGIYIEGFGGVRIEDMVLVREDTIEILTSLPRDLQILQEVPLDINN